MLSLVAAVEGAFYNAGFGWCRTGDPHFAPAAAQDIRMDSMATAAMPKMGVAGDRTRSHFLLRRRAVANGVRRSGIHTYLANDLPNADDGYVPSDPYPLPPHMTIMEIQIGN